ncbi:MAG: HAD family hydrolase [Beijerinckiaceae bacterium]
MTAPCTAVLFDMDDVLCAYHWRARVEALAAWAGRPAAEVAAAIWESGFEDEADRGAITESAYLVAFGQRLGRPITRAEWVANRREAMEPFPAMLALVGALKQAGIPCAVLSNNNHLTGAEIDALFPALRPLFGPHIYMSATLGLAKPDPQIYLAACARLGAAPAHTFFTDDLEANVAGARRAGLQAAVFLNEPDVRHHMRRAGLPV